MTHPNLSLKLMILGRRKPGTTLAEHRHHIRPVHGERVLRCIATDPANAPQRDVQNAVFDGSTRAAVAAPAIDPFALGRDFVTQVRAADFAALGRVRDTAFYREHLQGDEDHFVDQASVVFLPVRERVLLARGEPPAGAVKLFGVAAGRSRPAGEQRAGRGRRAAAAAGARRRGPRRPAMNSST